VGLLSLKPDPVIGIDIGSTAVKLLELSRSGKTYKVENYAIEPLPEKAVEDKNIIDIDGVGEIVQRLIKRAKPKAQAAAVAVAGPAVITKVIDMMAGLSDDDLRAAIEIDAEQYLSYPIEEVNLDFEILGISEKDENRVDVLLAASRSENVDSRLAVLELADLKPKVVDIEKYALENAFKLIIKNDPEIQEDETIALIEIGSSTSSIYVLAENEVVFTREEIFGGKRLIEDIQNTYGLSYEEANLAIRSGDLPEDYDTAILEYFRNDLAQQVSRMVQYYYATSSAASRHGKLSHIMISGGCAVIDNILDSVNHKVGGHVTIANPFSFMTVANKVDEKLLLRDAPALMTVCGLALRTFDEY